MLELHVWGPGFGLPSIDPHCLAAIAYLQQAVPKNKWRLIASSDTSLSPSAELPVLRNKDIWIGGFRNIFHYVAQHSGGEWILDAGLPEQAAADCIAFSSFIEAHGQPLLDLSLYVSTLNYTGVTRPLFNTFQSFPLPYLTPPALRNAAKARTAHLGLSSLDIDSTSEEAQSSASIIPDRLRKPKTSVSSLLAASPESKASIRLDALARNFFEPLKALKGKKQFFVSDRQFTSLDCLILGYLSLMLVPELPQPWLSTTLKEKFKSLASWTEDVRQSIYGKDVTLEDAFLGDLTVGGKRETTLPWSMPQNKTFAGVGSAFASGLADSLPFLGALRHDQKAKHYDIKAKNDEVTLSSWQSWSVIGTLITGVGLAAAYLLHQGILVLPSEENASEQKRATDYGAAGAALSVLLGPSDRPRQVERNYSHGEPVVEVDVNLKDGEFRTTETVL